MVEGAMDGGVLANLLDSTLMLSPEQGCVRVAMEGSRLRVIDEGPGFGADAGPGMFEQFRQGARPGVKHQGVGLGLSIVARLVALNGGRVEIEPEVPGTTGACVRVEWKGARA